MKKRDKVLDYLSKHEGCSFEEAAKAVKTSKKYVARIIKETLEGAKQEGTILKLKDENRALLREIKLMKKKLITTESVKEEIFEIRDSEIEIPDWTKNSEKKKKKDIVVPSIMLSDLHAGEYVDPEKIFGLNAYNLDMFKQRMVTTTKNSLSVLTDYFNYDYDGIVICLNGDLISGDIHEELSMTNDAHIMPSVLAVVESVSAMINAYVKKFGKVHVVANAGGNHSRTTKKIPAKVKAHTNLDWLIARILQWNYKQMGNKKVSFLISDADDVTFDIYNHKYRMTHGDQARGGMGYIGVVAPLTRLDNKKRKTVNTYKMPYDTMLIGHYHTYMVTNNYIANGSMVGYNEFAMKINADFAPPVQALWFTDPKVGRTFSAPVFCESTSEVADVRKYGKVDHKLY